MNVTAPNVGPLEGPWGAAPGKPTYQPKYKAKPHYRSVPKKVEAVCGHKIDAAAPPKNNCDGCWMSFFADPNKKAFTEAALKHLEQGKEDVLKHSGGVRFVKHLRRYAELKELVDRMSEGGTV